MNPVVNFYFEKARLWKEEFLRLRALALETGLTEELKWGVPCYTLNGKNVFLIHGFKGYCALLFHKGALMPDTEKLLVQQTDNVQGPRQMRFRHMQDLLEQEPLIKKYMQEAIVIEKSGQKLVLKSTTEFAFPVELQQKMEDLPALKTAFASLSPGRQRGYLLYFSSAKQSKTREARIEKYLDSILNGKGLDD
ncbi:MAG: YdeI/OmpD-associated family protein [Bacteroidetes bacterium]|nr:YdeI/OmpD-associated family protein [Bacteroidota bacterium]